MPVERRWTYAGMECAVLSMGTHLCGYVLVEEGHPWRGLGPHDEVPGGPNPDVVDRMAKDVPVEGLFAAMMGGFGDWASTLQGHVSVFGGLTFADTPDWAEGWWIGFDTMHPGSAGPPIDGEADEGHVWTIDEAAEETENLALQVVMAREPAK